MVGLGWTSLLTDYGANTER